MNSNKPKKQLFCSLLGILVFGWSVYSQSGRRAREIKPAAPSPQQQKPKPTEDDRPADTLEKHQDYRCSEDGSLARIQETDDMGEAAISLKDVDVQAVLTGKPQPSYTREARRNGIQGFVTVRVLLSARGKIARVRVLKGLPAGLTDNAIRAACKIEFKPARKNAEAVAQWLTAEYVFRLADSSVFTPWSSAR